MAKIIMAQRFQNFCPLPSALQGRADNEQEAHLIALTCSTVGQSFYNSELFPTKFPTLITWEIEEEVIRQNSEFRISWMGIQTPTNCGHRVDGGDLNPLLIRGFAQKFILTNGS